MLDSMDQAATPPSTDNWSARVNKHTSPMVLLVSGRVQVSRTNLEPRLVESRDDGTTLTLDLTIETVNDFGSELMAWKPADFDRAVEAGEFTDVHILWNGAVIVRCKVADAAETPAARAPVANVATSAAQVPIEKTADKAREAAKKVLDAVGKAAASPAGKVAAGAVAVGAVGAAAVATAVSLKKPKAKKKVAKKAKVKSKAKAAAKSKTKTKSKAKKVKAAPKKKAAKKSTKKSAKKSAKKSTRKSAKKSAKKSAMRSVTKKRGTKKATGAKKARGGKKAKRSRR